MISLILTAGLCWRIAAPAFTDQNRRIAPTDFSAFWAGARLAALGRPLPPTTRPPPSGSNASRLPAMRPRTCHGPYLYPPVFLLLSLPFGAMKLAMALPASCWLVMRCSPSVCDASRACRAGGRVSWVAILLSPGALLNVVAGQTGSLTSACSPGGILAVGTRPWLAGACLGLLVYKPQFGLGIPVVLMAGRQWRALAACGATALGLCVLSLGRARQRRLARLFRPLAMGRRDA